MSFVELDHDVCIGRLCPRVIVGLFVLSNVVCNVFAFGDETRAVEDSQGERGMSKPQTDALIIE